MESSSKLKVYKRKIKWGTPKSMPFSQGWAINQVIKTYNIPAIKWGWNYDVIGLQTKKQYLFWRDNGGNLSFLGLINK